MYLGSLVSTGSKVVLVPKKTGILGTIWNDFLRGATANPTWGTQAYVIDETAGTATPVNSQGDAVGPAVPAATVVQGAAANAAAGGPSVPAVVTSAEPAPPAQAAMPKWIIYGGVALGTLLLLAPAKHRRR